MSERGFACIGLDNPKTNANVGGVLRATQCYGGKLVVVAGTRHKKNCVDTTAAYRHLPLLQVEDLRDAIPYDCVPVAVDLLDDATSLPEYTHPESAFYVFGAEDATLGKRTTEWCRDKVYIPTRYCMNLAATVNVVLYDRLAKRGRV